MKPTQRQIEHQIRLLNAYLSHLLTMGGGRNYSAIITTRSIKNTLKWVSDGMAMSPIKTARFGNPR